MPIFYTNAEFEITGTFTLLGVDERLILNYTVFLSIVLFAPRSCVRKLFHFADFFLDNSRIFVLSKEGHRRSINNQANTLIY